MAYNETYTEETMFKDRAIQIRLAKDTDADDSTPDTPVIDKELLRDSLEILGHQVVKIAAVMFVGGALKQIAVNRLSK